VETVDVVIDGLLVVHASKINNNFVKLTGSSLHYTASRVENRLDSSRIGQ
jgi:hypothetical protein